MSDHISFSAVDAFDTCAKRFQHERLQKGASPVSDPLIDGRHIHAIIEAIVRFCETAEIESIDSKQAAAIVEQHFSTSDQASTARFAEVMVMAKGFAKRYKNTGNLIELEQWIEMTLAEDVPPFVCRLDMVERYFDADGSFIGNTDWKSSWSAGQDDRTVFQLHTQGMALHNSYPNERIKVRNGFVRFGQDSDWDELKEYDFENARGRVVAIYRRMKTAEETGVYTASPGKACGYCPIALQCVEAMGLREQGHLALTKEDAEKQVADVLVLEAAIKTRKDALKKWVDVNGPVTAIRTNSKGVAETMEASYKLPAESLTLSDTPAAFEALGDELFGLFTGMSKPKLKKYENDPRLDGLWVKTQGKPRFAIGKAEDEEDD